jgi:hypothetical protein
MGVKMIKTILWIIAIILIIAIGLVLGCAGGVLSIPVLIIQAGLNWIVPALGGPTFTFKMTLGLIIVVGLIAVILGK